MDNKFSKIGLALSGGAALGIAHIGVLQALTDQNIPIHCISGTSAGAIVAGCFAFGMTPKEIEEQAKNLSWFKLSSFSYSALGLATTKSIGDIIIKLLGDVNIEDAKIPLSVVATNIETGDEVIFKKGNLALAIMASVCVPGVFVPVEYNKKLLVDGGLVKNLPLSELETMGAEYKIGVNLARWRYYKKPSNLVEVMLTSMDILTHKQTNIDSGIADVIIEPHLEEFTTSDFKKAAEIINEGYRATVLAIPKIQKLKNPTGFSIKTKLGFWKHFFSWFK